MSRADALWAFLHRFKTDRRLTAILLLPNALGIGYGYYYYWQVGQFDPSSPFARAVGWWPLIADSPNAVLLISASLVLHHFGRRSKILDALAFTQMVYVGLWTTSLFLLYPDTMGTFDWHAFPENANPLLFVSHMAMPLEALVLVHDMRRDTWRAPGILGILAFSVFFVAVDYWGPHLHPAPFLHPCAQPQTCPGGDAALHATSPWLMAATLAAWLLAIRQSPNRNGSTSRLRAAGAAHPPAR